MATTTQARTRTARKLANIIGGKEVVSASARSLPVISPVDGELLAELPLSTAADLDAAVQAAAKAQRAWAHEITVKDRAQVMFKAKQLYEKNIKPLAEVLHAENGKTIPEAKAELARGIECIEFAASLPQVCAGQVLEVSRGVECKFVRAPLGVVTSITPFNFPAMVPLWMTPLAITLGNAIILKPSEQTPLSALELVKIFEEAGCPKGIISVVHGDREIVEAICDHPRIAAIGFVGSTPVARLVHERGSKQGKRVRALGGAKNHLVVVPDADVEMTVTNVIASATGCAGQRCMAASTLIAVGECDHILDKIKQRMGQLKAGRDFGAIISKKALARIRGYIERAEAGGAQLAVDGRELIDENVPEGGNYIGPSVFDFCAPDHEVSCDEIFGPTLTIIRAKTLEEAIEIENHNPFGNAAAIYTSSGETAQYFAQRAGAGMIGVNIGVPVPREPFAFGGWNESIFGDGDITGMNAIDFWCKHKKITTKWSDKYRKDWTS